MGDVFLHISVVGDDVGQGDAVDFETEYDDRKGKWKAATVTVTSIAVEVVKDEAATEEAAMVEGVMTVEVMAVARVTVARVHMVVRARAKVVLSASHAASGQQVTVLMAIAVDFHIIHDLEPQNTIQYNTITSDGRQ